MLSTPAPFPYPGAPAFLRPTADSPLPLPCRILQRRADGRLSISLQGREFGAHHPDIRARASGNRTVDLTDLAETEAEALAVAKPKRRRRSARR